MPALLPETYPDSTGGAEDLYHRDGFSWAMQQAAALCRRDAAAIDWDRVIEGIEDSRIRRKDRWTSQCARVIEHLLASEHWDSARPETLQHWVRAALNFRSQMAKVLRRNPGLRSQRIEMFATAWEDGRSDAVSWLTDYEELSLKQRNPRAGAAGRAVAVREKQPPAGSETAGVCSQARRTEPRARAQQN